MTDPMKLAERIEAYRALMAIPDDEEDEDSYYLKPRDQRLICAALRLAEEVWEIHSGCFDSFGNLTEDCDLDRTMRKPFLAYRAAKEGR